MEIMEESHNSRSEFQITVGDGFFTLQQQGIQ